MTSEPFSVYNSMIEDQDETSITNVMTGERQPLQTREQTGEQIGELEEKQKTPQLTESRFLKPASTAPLNSLAPPEVSSLRSSFPSANSIQRVSGSRLVVPGISRIQGRNKPRAKVALEAGYSALDWARLQSSGKNLRGIHNPELIKVNRQELAKHKDLQDAWTVLNGKVYNVTPYLKFHPGGVEEIMKCAGKDSTKLFMYTHSWVNYEHMLNKCFIGFYVKE